MVPGGRAVRLTVVASALVVVLTTGCGGGGSGDERPAPPAARIDPDAKGTFTGPVNRARRTADQLDQHQQDRDDETGGLGGP